MKYLHRLHSNGLWVPAPPAVIVPSLEGGVDIPSMGVQGFFTVELLDARTQHVKQRLEFPNLITDAGLNKLCRATSYGIATGSLLYMGCGTGSNVPAITDTGLQAEITPTGTHRSTSNGSIADVYGYEAGPPDYHYLRRTRLFTETQANGNLTELGWFSEGTAALWSRQLFKDVSGTPTTIVKTSADQLRITYELRVYPPLSDVTGTITISGNTYDYTIRVQGANTSPWYGIISGNYRMSATYPYLVFESPTLVTRTQLLSGTSYASSSVVNDAYADGNFYLDKTFKWEPSTGNFAGGIGKIGGFANEIYGTAYQVSFSPALPKNNTKRLTLVFRESVGRYP